MDRPNSAERFRDDILIPALKANTEVIVYMDGTAGYASSFLQEAFGGLRKIFTAGQLRKKLSIISTDASIRTEVWNYIDPKWI
jgi:hypothetical protein